MKTPLGEVIMSYSGFQRIEFRDTRGAQCMVQQGLLSETGPSTIWLGVDLSSADLSDVTGMTRIYIDQKQAKALVAVLEQWIKSGSFVDTDR